MTGQDVVWADPNVGRKALALIALAAAAAGASAVPLPGLNPEFVGSPLLRETVGRLTLGAIGANPFVGAIAIVEIARLAIPPLARWAARPQGAARLDAVVWLLALSMATFQGWNLALAAERIEGLVDEPGIGFRLVLAASTLGATAAVGALARHATRVGAGDGFLVWMALGLLATMERLAAVSVSLAAEGRAASPAIAALVVVAAAGVLVAAALASPRGQSGALGFGGGRIDATPALIAMAGSPYPAALIEATVWPQMSAVWATAITLATAAGLIALAAAMRARLPGAAAPNHAAQPATLTVMAIVVALPVIRLFAPSLLAPSGYAIVFTVAAAIGVVGALRGGRLSRGANANGSPSFTRARR